MALLSCSSGLPLGLVWLGIPAWMARAGVDIKVIGLFTLAQAPWTFKVLWAPFMDRYPLPFLGRKRGYILAAQLVLTLTLTAATPGADGAGAVAPAGIGVVTEEQLRAPPAPSDESRLIDPKAKAAAG